MPYQAEYIFCIELDYLLVLANLRLIPHIDMTTFIRSFILYLTVFNLTSPLYAQETSPIDTLNEAFRQHHQQAVTTHLTKLRNEVPMLVQDLLSMSLYLPHQDKPLRFRMDKRTYMNMATISHPPLTLFDLVHHHGFNKPLSSSLQQALLQYKNTLTNARLAYQKSNELNADELKIMSEIFLQSESFITAALKENQVSLSRYKQYLATVTPLVNQNLTFAACDLLTQFKDQVYLWRKQYPQYHWQNLRIAILGFHQPRHGYALKQLFRKLLKEPHYEKHVIYMEFQASLYPSKETNIFAKALLSLAKYDYDQHAARVLYNDAKGLESDVLAHSTKKILKDWSLDW